MALPVSPSIAAASRVLLSKKVATGVLAFIGMFAAVSTLEIVMRRKKIDKRNCAASKSPARRLTESVPYRTTGGAFIAGLTDWHAEHESPHERLAVAHLALCRDVVTLASQPCQETYSDEDGEERRYIPDLIVTTGSARLILEVKALTFLATESSISKYAAIARHYAVQHQPFAFLVDAQLEELPRAASVRLLFRYATSTVPAEVLERAATALTNGALQIRELCQQASLQLVDVYTLIATRRLCIDWEYPVSADVMVSLPDQPYGGLKLEHILHSTRFSSFLEELAMGRRPTDRQVLADAQTWRQSRHPLTPYSFVGGLPKRKIDGDLGGKDGVPRSPGLCRDHAPGGHPEPPDGNY